MSQLALDFSFRSASGREDFLVSAPNSDAVSWIDAWPNWTSPFLLIVGDEGAGKSHLASVWAKNSEAKVVKAIQLDGLDLEAITHLGDSNVILEDVDDQTSEKNLFHLYNVIKENGNFLLMTSRFGVMNWNVYLPDLKSRLGAIQIANIDFPDDELFSAILIKLFSDKQLPVTPEVIQYLVARLERSFKGAKEIVAELDKLTLEEKRKLTIPLVRKALDKDQ